MKQMIQLLTVSIAACGLGCGTVYRGNGECEIRIANRSGGNITFVVLDAKGVYYDFGLLAYTRHGSSTAGGCNVRFVEDFVIEWREGSVKRVAVLNLAKYRKWAREIRSMTFCYVGSGQWDILAQKGIEEESVVVRP
jgi:hypothetical protein